MSYSATNGEIASPVGKGIVDSLTRKTGNSLPTNHNNHPSLRGGSAQINGPATDSIVPSGSVGSGGFKEQK
jgi:hypothetical protein